MNNNKQNKQVRKLRRRNRKKKSFRKAHENLKLNSFRPTSFNGIIWGATRTVSLHPTRKCNCYRKLGARIVTIKNKNKKNFPIIL